MTLKNVSLDTVQGFASNARVSTSYIQDNRHASVTDKFQPIQPASVGAALAERGFECTGIITGKGRHADKLDFQRTIARYRAKDAFDVAGLSLDIIYVSKHLGRGCDELRLGFYRGTCANQWAVGTLFEMIRFRHTGNPLDDIANGIAAVLQQRAKLVETIEKMQARILTTVEIDALCQKFASIRLGNRSDIVSVNHRALSTVHRADDAKLDLFTVANVLQENVVRFPLQYQVKSTDSRGNEIVRNQSTRRFRESSSQLVDLNGEMFDAAMALVA